MYKPYHIQHYQQQLVMVSPGRHNFKSITIYQIILTLLTVNDILLSVNLSKFIDQEAFSSCTITLLFTSISMKKYINYT